MKEYRWMKIDTASIMFTCLSTKKWGRTFRMAVVFKDEEVNPELLKRAVYDLKQRYPYAYTQLKKGFFWNYQEAADALPEIREEYTRPLLPITYNNNGRPDFRIVYYKRRLGIESAHHIGDGKGVSTYFNALLERYVELCDNPEIEYVFEAPSQEEAENAFVRYCQKNGEKATEEETEAFSIPGEIEPGFLQLIFALASSDEIYHMAKAKGLTITEYIAAALILGSVRSSDKPIDRVISIAIPVNLRRFFPTSTLRNFTIQSQIDFDPKGKTDWAFDEICDSIRGQLKSRLLAEELQKTLNRFGSLAANPVIKLVPNFIKLPVLRLKQKSSHSSSTTILTNIGEAALSDKLKTRVERVDGINGDTSGYGLLSTCSVYSGVGFISLCFSICSHDTRWVKECIRALAGQGLNIRVESTHGNGETEEECTGGSKRCKECDVDLSETYSKCPVCGAEATDEEVRLKGLKNAPYPHNSPVKPEEKAEKTSSGFSAEKIKAFFNT